MAEEKPAVHPASVPPGPLPPEAARVAPPAKKVVHLTQTMQAHVGDTVSMNGTHYNNASGVFNWWATAPNGREVLLMNPTMPGASFTVDMVGDYKVCVDTDDGVATTTVNVREESLKKSN